MRWRFPHPRESAARELVTAHIDAWWRTFVGAAKRLDDYFQRRSQWDLTGWMREHLGAIDERIMWEFGPSTRDGGGRSLVLTPEAEHRLRPLVDVVLLRAPELEGWEFHARRLAEDPSSALRTVAERTSVDLGAWTGRADISDEGLIDVTFAPPPGVKDSEENRAAALLLVEAMMGEDLMDVWIGDVDVAPRTDGVAMSDLGGLVRAMVEAQSARRPEQPYWRRAAEGPWSLLRLAPKLGGAADYAGQQDMLIAKTLDLDLWKAQHGQRPFHSRRFSRSGELMATLKIDGAEGLPTDGLADKSSIEDAIAKALEPRGLGAQIGGGTGMRYSYVDLALTDVQAAMQAMGPVLREGKLPKRTWLLFFDAELADEWIPLWDDAPPPPH